MAHQDFLFRIRRPASLIAFNTALPANFKLIHKPASEWLDLPGVHLDPIEEGDLSPVDNGGVVHLNLRLTPLFSGWDGLFMDEDDPDYGDLKLDKSKFKRWFKNNGGGVLTDMVAQHPRSGRADMDWWPWTSGPEYVHVTIATPLMRRRFIL